MNLSWRYKKSMQKKLLKTTEYSTTTVELSDELQNLLFDTADNLNKYYNAPVLQCSKDRKGLVLLRTTSYVGVIDVSDQLAIEISPKIYHKNDDINIQNLFFMLSYSGMYDLTSTISASLRRFNGSFFEALIAIFANELLDKVKNSLHYEYVLQQKDRNYLHGKLLTTQHIKRNSNASVNFYTQKDEFISDNPLNQTFKFVTQGLYQLTKNNDNRRKLRRALMYLDRVSTKVITKHSVNGIKLNRLNKRFDNLLALSRLFINNQSLIAKSGSFNSWTILIDMNQLFENFVAMAMKRSLVHTHFDIVTQGPVRKFAYNLTEGRAVFNTRPDISVVERGANNQPLKIVDTKYKKLIADGGKGGVSQTDLYQMFAYSRRYETPDITLIYPSTNHIKPHALELPDKTIVKIRKIDLNRNIMKDISQIEYELKQLIVSGA